MHYYWNNDSLMFNGLVVLRFKEWKQIILDLHDKLVILTKVKIRCYFWHNKNEEVKMVVCTCKQCELVTKIGLIRFDAKDFKCIPIGDHFY
jgi:hypothetical protein